MESHRNGESSDGTSREKEEFIEIAKNGKLRVFDRPSLLSRKYKKIVQFMKDLSLSEFRIKENPEIGKKFGIENTDFQISIKRL